MTNTCYIVLLSSGIDSTGAFLNLINENDLENDLIIPTYIWWREKFTKVIEKEYTNCEKIIEYIKQKYKDKKLKIKNLVKISLPLIFYEDIRSVFKRLDREDYFCYFRNLLFIISSLSYIMNYFKIQGIDKYKTIKFVSGFIGYEPDENKKFTIDTTKLINNYIQDSSKSGIIEKVDFYSPYLIDEETKARSLQFQDIIKYNDQEILKFTWSCWRNNDKPCGDCPGCISRKDKFEGLELSESKLKDPML